MDTPLRKPMSIKIRLPEELTAAISFATALREAGIRAQLHAEKKKFKQKLSYADKLSIPYAAFLGEDEISQGKVTVKNLGSGEQQTLTPGEAVALIRETVAALSGGTPIVDKAWYGEKYHLDPPQN